ncbi:MAG TPA: hypothetical protein VNI60_01505 [Pyrinomonadaceae bacterium]|nr:hypothetical protein [Pyrinomonadaceae bacterium]
MTLLKIKNFYWAIQFSLVAPFLPMWFGVFRFYQTRSADLLKTPAEKQFDWSLNILLCLFVALSMLAVIGQIKSR